jgi:hypothetical protein
MTVNIYAAPKLPSSLRPNANESELSFVLPLARRNHVINPSFEIDAIGDTEPYNYESGSYSYATNSFSSKKSMGSIVAENVFNGFRAMRMVMSDTTTSFVYGRTQPITAPLSMTSNQYIFSGKAYYFIRGALTFYTFIPAIDKYSPFSKFEQSSGTTHTIDVNVYATVDANGYPNGTFNTQNIISSRSIDMTIPPATYFTEDIEPNVIGRRKNPFWVRHVVPFSIRYSDETPTFLRFSISNNAVHAGQTFIFYLDALQVEFFDDEYQIHTTYLDGDYATNDVLPSYGYSWDGAPKKSTSYRSVEAHSGGILYNFQTDFDMSVLNSQGLGLPPPNNQITPYVSSDGQQYVGTGIDSRKISIDGYIIGDTLLDTIRKAGQLQFFLSKARTGIGTKRRFYYRVPIGCNEYSDYTYFDAVVDQITVDHLHENPSITLGFELHNIDVYFYGDNYAYQSPRILRNEQELPTWPVILFKAQGGNPNSDYKPSVAAFDVREDDSYFGYNSYALKSNGAVRCFLELQSGQIMFGGDFTAVFYTINGVTRRIDANHLALLNPDGTVLPVRDYALRNTNTYNTYNGVSGPGATVYCMVQTSDGSIMVGGRFNKALNRTYDCKNIWYIPKLLITGAVDGENRDVQNGLTADNAPADKVSSTLVKTMLYDPIKDVIYVGGYFKRSVSRTNALRNIAKYNISVNDKWQPMTFGVNGIVNTMSFYQNRRYVFIGGDFTAAYANTASSLFTQTKRGLLYDTNIGVSEANRIKSLTQVAVTVSTTSIPATSSTFDYAVKCSVTTNVGQVIIGGQFNFIDYNDVTTPTSFINRFRVPKIVQWDGFSRFTPMGDGVGNNDELGISFTEAQKMVVDVCTCPYSNDIYAVGQFNQIGNIEEGLFVARWAKNRWEAMDFELNIKEVFSVYVSKQGYGFISARTATSRAGNKNKFVEPYPIVIDNVGLNTQFSIEISNPIKNYGVGKIISIYNITTDKSMTFNMDIDVGETITLNFSRDNIRAVSNIKGRIPNSLIGGGTFANFYLAEGKNILKILGGVRAGSGNKLYAGRFIRPLQINIRYAVRQITPYQLFESDTIKVDESLVGWQLGKSKLGLDTILIGNLKTQYPSFDWTNDGFLLDVAEVGISTVPIN